MFTLYRSHQSIYQLHTYTDNFQTRRFCHTVFPRFSGDQGGKPQTTVNPPYTLRVLSIMPKISETSLGIQMEKSVSVSSDRNIRDHLWRWFTYFGWNSPSEICRSIFGEPVLCTNKGIRKRNKKWQEPDSYWLTRFNREMSLHFAWEFPLISGRSVWHNGKHPLCTGSLSLLVPDVYHNNGKSEIPVGIIQAVNIITRAFEQVIKEAYISGLVMARYPFPVITHKLPTDTYKIRL